MNYCAQHGDLVDENGKVVNASVCPKCDSAKIASEKSGLARLVEAVAAPSPPKKGGTK